MNLTRKSKLLSKVLRHSPELIGITLDQHGYVEVSELLSALASYGKPLTQQELQKVVEFNDKKRFAFSEDGLRIRAVQGHSVQVELKLREAAPPQELFHGTSKKFLEAIKAEGLKPMKRHHVHLSQDRNQAFKVGSRRANPVILRVQAKLMGENGHTFFVSENGVWLTDRVPPEYLEVLD